MKYFYLALLFSGIAQQLYAAETQQHQININTVPQRSGEFQHVWSQELSPVNEPCYARSLPNAVAVTSKSGTMCVFDETDGKLLQKIVLPSQEIRHIESLGDDRVVYSESYKGILKIVKISSAEQDSVEHVSSGLDQIYGMASIPARKRLVAGGLMNMFRAKIVVLQTDTWQHLFEVWAGDGVADSLTPLPNGNSNVAFRRRYISPEDIDLLVLNSKTGATGPVRLPDDITEFIPEAVVGNNVLIWKFNGISRKKGCDLLENRKKRSSFDLRLYRNNVDLNVNFPRRDDLIAPADLVSESSGTIAVGLNNELVTLNGSGRVLQRFRTGTFSINEVRCNSRPNKPDLITVMQSDPQKNTAKISVLRASMQRAIKARL